MMDYLPIFADVRNRRVLVVGEGEAAQRKIELLRRAGADVHVAGAMEFRAADVQGCAAVFGATGSLEIDRRVADAARAAGVAVNVVDRPELSSFIMPAVVDRSPIIVAIGSGGRAPVLARVVRGQIEALLPARLGELANMAGRFRHAVRGLVPDAVARRRFWERFFDSPLALRVVAGDRQADGEMVALINRTGSPPRGAVYVVGIGAGDADLLTVQALRLMQRADIVVHDAPCPPEILDRIRRDAERVLVERDEVGGRALREALSGRRVLRLVVQPDQHEITELRRRGIEVIVAPGLTAAQAGAWHAAEPWRRAV